MEIHQHQPLAVLEHMLVRMDDLETLQARHNYQITSDLDGVCFNRHRDHAPLLDRGGQGVLVLV